MTSLAFSESVANYGLPFHLACTVVLACSSRYVQFLYNTGEID